jgi:hypothetical protein
LRGVIPLGENGKESLDIEKFHLPTGWVLMEDVLRFLISELEVNPPCGDSWPEVLEESRALFFTEFSVKGRARE